MSTVSFNETFDSEDRSSVAPTDFAQLSSGLWEKPSTNAMVISGQSDGIVRFTDIYAATDTFKVYPWNEAPALEDRLSAAIDAGAQQQPASPPGGSGAEQTTPAATDAGVQQQPASPSGGGAEAVEPESGAGSDQTTAPGQRKDTTDQVVEGQPGAATGSIPPNELVINPISEAVGKSVKDIQPDINVRVGCALAVSHVLSQADSRIAETNNNAKLEKSLIAADYERVSLSEAKTGDVIIGHRPDGMPGHAAVYTAPGMVFNNNSDSGVMQIDTVDKFKQGMHDAKGNFNKNGFSEVVVYRRRS